MNTVDLLQDVLQDEMILQTLYNKHMIETTNPEARQLFTQLRDTKLQNLSQLQEEIKNRMKQGRTQ